VPNEFDPAAMTPSDSPLTLEDVFSSPTYAELVTPTVQPGDAAPDFTLERADDPRVTVQLSEVARNQPVALIFGSYT
jgi:hypothetical protein